ncbi:MAG TPA: ATP-binding cassette domain-containing protein [bacterium]|nr:ATP-binding cassette domain-containing protein [bacterium]
MLAVRVEELTKDFDGLRAVDHVSFSIAGGRIFGLLGPNGAGKSTTLAMLSTVLRPTSGAAWINGFDIRSDPSSVRKSIGIVFQDQSLDEELTCYENMDFHGRLYRVPRRIRQPKIGELLTLVGLAERQGDLVKTFSGGMRRRLEIARGLLHEPRVLFLDEPTLGLDPQTRNHLWAYIERLNREREITIILTTHYMDEADKLCDEVAIIDHGRIIASDTPAALKRQIGGDVVILESSNNDRILPHLQALPAVKQVELRDGAISIKLDQAERHIAELVTRASQDGVSINSISVHKPTLEDVFLHFTGRTIREEDASGKDRMRMARRLWRR